VRKQIAIIALKYGLGLGLLVWVVWSHWDRTEGGVQVGIAGVLERRLHPGFFVLSAVIAVMGVLLTFVRWYILVRAQDIPFTLPSALRLGLVGYYYNTFLPGSVGGDIIKAACIAWEQSRRTVAVATVLVDRVVGLCGLLWLAALLGGLFWASGMFEEMAGSAAGTLETIVLGAVALTAGSIVFWIGLGLFSVQRSSPLASRLERIPKIGHMLAELWRAGLLYRRRGRAIALTLAMSMVSHAGFVLTFYCVARSLFPADEIPSLATHYLIVPMGMMVKGFFPAPGGVGGGEYGFGTLYDLVHFPFAAGVLASLVQRVIEWSWGLVGYLVYLRMRPSLPKATAAEAAVAAGVS
jgi:uncharacterized protein (TIRG00374 family)